ncbi:hypothetical protein Tco_0921655 [Tanacetum coccineum]
MLTLIVHDKVDKSTEEFGDISGLLPNYNKSTILFGNLKKVDQEEILECVPFKIEKLPIKYLGVPLSSKRLSVNNCKILIDKIKSRVLNWKNKCLSYAGRPQLIAYVLESIHVYWASVFLLPKTMIKDINCVLKNFLWNQGEVSRGKAKVAWKNVCKPKAMGGLGLKDLEGWKNILKMRDEVRNFMIIRIGNGEKASVIYDNWSGAGILQSFNTNKDIYNARRSSNMVVKDIVEDAQCGWPEEWIVKGSFSGQNQRPKLGVVSHVKNWSGIVDEFVDMYCGNDINSIIRRMSLAASVLALGGNWKICMDAMRGLILEDVPLARASFWFQKVIHILYSLMSSSSEATTEGISRVYGMKMVKCLSQEYRVIVLKGDMRFADTSYLWKYSSAVASSDD